MPSAMENSLKRLRSDYVDLLLLHWRNPATPLFFELSDDEMDQIFALNANVRVVQARNHS